jgi:site-specific DNA-methyltransferase (adenine-specific)
VKNVEYSGSTDKVPEEKYQDNQVSVLDEIFRVTKPGGSFFYNHKIRWERGKLLHLIDWIRKTKWVVRQEIVWDRMIVANIRGWRFWQVEERVYWLYKPKDNNRIGVGLKSRHALLTSIWKFSPERGNPHPAPFPLSLPVRAIYSILDEEKGVVLDPYCGSGTTLVATKILGSDYIGIDNSKEYIKFSENRIRNYKREEGVALEEMEKHIVTKTFKERKKNGEFTGRHRSQSGKNKFVLPQKELALFDV